MSLLAQKLILANSEFDLMLNVKNFTYIIIIISKEKMLASPVTSQLAMRECYYIH